ncbi:MAG: hypothetical protein Kow006_12770 [Gammaproteobacteria bacterium]
MVLRQVLLALTLTIPMVAGADGCTGKMAEIDALLAAATSLSESVKSEIAALREEGETLHKEGDHEQSMELLTQALDLLKESQ